MLEVGDRITGFENYRRASEQKNALQALGHSSVGARGSKPAPLPLPTLRFQRTFRKQEQRLVTANGSGLEPRAPTEERPPRIGVILFDMCCELISEAISNVQVLSQRSTLDLDFGLWTFGLPL